MRRRLLVGMLERQHFSWRVNEINNRGGLINFLPLKRVGGYYIQGGGVFERWAS